MERWFQCNPLPFIKSVKWSNLGKGDSNRKVVPMHHPMTPAPPNPGSLWSVKWSNLDKGDSDGEVIPMYPTPNSLRSIEWSNLDKGDSNGEIIPM